MRGLRIIFSTAILGYGPGVAGATVPPGPGPVTRAGAWFLAGARVLAWETLGLSRHCYLFFPWNAFFGRCSRVLFLFHKHFSRKFAGFSMRQRALFWQFCDQISGFTEKKMFTDTIWDSLHTYFDIHRLYLLGHLSLFTDTLTQKNIRLIWTYERWKL